MKQILILLALCAVVGACDSGGSGSNGSNNNGPLGTPGPTTNPTPEPSATPIPEPDVFGETGNASFTLEAELPWGTNEGQFSFGCETNSATPTYTADTRLTVGAKYDEYQRLWVAGEGEAVLRLDETITKVEPKSIGKSLKVTESTVPEAPVGAGANVVCTPDPQNGDQCVSATRAGNLGLYDKCQVDAEPTLTYARGKLTMASGKTVTAYRIRAVFEGALNKDCSVQGTATETQVIFMSNDVPSPDFDYCGGTRIHAYRKIAKDGSTLELSLSERRVAP